MPVYHSLSRPTAAESNPKEVCFYIAYKFFMRHHSKIVIDYNLYIGRTIFMQDWQSELFHSPSVGETETDWVLYIRPAELLGARGVITRLNPPRLLLVAIYCQINAYNTGSDTKVQHYTYGYIIFTNASAFLILDLWLDMSLHTYNCHKV